MITRIAFHRFKQFRNQKLDLHPGVSLLGGGNNSGKSTILHGLAIWGFCRTAIEMERGAQAFLAGRGGKVSDWVTMSSRPSTSLPRISSTGIRSPVSRTSLRSRA